MSLITFPSADYPEDVLAKLVTNGDSHDHSGGDGAQIDHGNLSGAGTTSHGDIDTHVGAASPHSGHATLSTGKVPTNELGSGTADSTVYLRGDQTWATPAGGSGGAPPTWMPPDIIWKDADEIYLPSGRYFKGGNRVAGQYQDLTGLASYWDISGPIACDIDGTYSAGSASGIVGGAKQPNTWYSVWLVGNDANSVMLLPYIKVGAVDYDSTNAGKTTIVPGTHHSAELIMDLPCSTDDGSSWANYTIRMVVSGSSLGTRAFTKIRVTFKGKSDANCYIDAASVVEQGSGSNGAAAPTQLLFSGGATTTLSSGTPVTTDWLTFAGDGTKNYLICVDIGSTASYLATTTAGGTQYYKAATDAALTQNLSGATTNTNMSLLTSIEVGHADTDFISANDLFNTYQLVKVSFSSLNGSTVTIEDSTTATDSLIIDGDKVGSSPSLVAGDWLQMIPPAATDCVYLGDVFFDASSNLKQFTKHGDRYSWSGGSVWVHGNQGTVAQTPLVVGVSPQARRVDLTLQAIRNGDEIYYHYVLGTSGSTRDQLYGFESGTNTNLRLNHALSWFPLSAQASIRGMFNIEPGTAFVLKGQLQIKGFEV